MGRIITPEEYDLPRELSVSFTGHRPDKLPWGDDERDERCIKFIDALEKEILRAYNGGARRFLSGMAQGVDLIAAEAVIRLSGVCPGMELVAVFPYGAGNTVRARNAASHAKTAVSMRERYFPSCFEERNAFLVRHSERIICGFNGRGGSGTARTMTLARNAGIDIVIINV